MSPITQLRARYMVDPDGCRDAIIEALEQNMGNAQKAADDLGCSYTTLWRLLDQDSKLASAVNKIRRQLAEQGVSQRGWRDE